MIHKMIEGKKWDGKVIGSLVPRPFINWPGYEVIGGKGGERTAVPYSRKFSREKTFTNFEILQLFPKVFSTKFGGVALFGGTSEQSVKSFFRKFVKVSHYTVLFLQVLPTHIDWPKISLELVSA